MFYEDLHQQMSDRRGLMACLRYLGSPPEIVAALMGFRMILQNSRPDVGVIQASRKAMVVNHWPLKGIPAI